MRRFLTRFFYHTRERCRTWFGRDFDYRTAYRKFDLTRDHWTIVGPKTREAHEEFGQGKRQFLVAQGLTPRSRLLDVGCGTGQLTEHLLDYLSSEGVYYGTDIAPEAVAFCREKFNRPNFFFLQNEMTWVPLTGLVFDFIYLGSVFTHLYPEEIRALLLDLKRLLAPGGVLIADVFLATAQRFVRGRGMVILDEARVAELFEATGLSTAKLHEWDWQPGVRRTVFQFKAEAAH